jgi:hypothetical protein
MTMKTTSRVVCNCGHEGELVCRENDAPFSTSWERYTLTGFAGGTQTGRDPGWMKMSEVFQDLKATCPDCSRSG